MTELNPSTSAQGTAGSGTHATHGPVPIKDTLSLPRIKPRPGASITVVAEKCHFCHDLGHFRKDPKAEPGDPDFGETVHCPYCNGGNDPQTLRRLSGLSEHEQQWRLTDLDTQGRPAVQRLEQACRELIGGRRRVITVWGTCGNGKTLALQAVVNEMAERRVPAMYYTTKQMLDHLRDGIYGAAGERSEGMQARLKRLEDVPYLALDEFDKVSSTDWVREQLTYFIDRRHRASEAGTHATLIAMNADPAQQEPWIASRLMAGCNRVVHLDGGDLRSLLTE